MKNIKFKLLILALWLICAFPLKALDNVATVKFFEDDKYLEALIGYSVMANNDIILHSIDCFSDTQLTNIKEIFIKQAVAELIRRSAGYQGYNAYQPYQQKIYIPSCTYHTSTQIPDGQYSGFNDYTAYKEYKWQNHVGACDSIIDTTNCDKFQLTLQLIGGRVVILNKIRIPKICTNPPPCANGNLLINSFVIQQADSNVNPNFANTTPFGMPLNSHFVKENKVGIYREGTKSIYYMNMYEEYSVPNDLTFYANIRKPQIREDSDSLNQIELKGLFKSIIEKTIIGIIDKGIVEDGTHNVVLEFPELVIGDKNISYGNPTIGGTMTFVIEKNDNGILIVDGFDNCSLDYIPNFGNQITDINKNNYLKFKDIELLPTDYLYTFNTDLQIGKIDGRFQIDDDGSFSYNIPIETLPGTNGIEPNISLNYNSNSEENIAGYGWGLSYGQSIISRQFKTKNIDSTNRDIRFNNNDKLVLDGKKLIYQGMVNNRRYYYLEGGGNYISVELLNDTQLSDYCYFRAIKNDGTIIEYGTSDDSKYTVSGKVLSWYIKKIIDPNGNYIEYNYSKKDNELLIDKINYTGHYSKTSLTSYNDIPDRQPFNTIKFVYRNKIDIPKKYLNGINNEDSEPIKENYNSLLESIKIITNDEIFKEYKLSYENKNYIYLKKVDLFGKNDNKYNPTIFKYKNDYYTEELQINSMPIISDESNYTTPIGYIRKDLFGDFNGDGYLDKIFIDINSHHTPVSPNNTLWYLQLGKKFNGTQIEYEPAVLCNTINFDGLYDDYIETQKYLAYEGYENCIDLQDAIVIDLDENGRDEIILCKTNEVGDQYIKRSLDIYMFKYDELTQKIILNNVPLVSNILINDEINSKTGYPAILHRGTDFMISDINILPGDYDGDNFKEIMLTGLLHQHNTNHNDTTITYYFDIVNNAGEITNINYNIPIEDTYYFLNSEILCSQGNYFTSTFQLGKIDCKDAILYYCDRCCPMFKQYFRTFHTDINKHTLDSISTINRIKPLYTYFDSFNEKILNWGDFNGDGMKDFSYGNKIYYWDNFTFNVVDLNSVSQNENNYNNDPYKCYSYIGDFNGDNKDDIFEYRVYTRIDENNNKVADYEYIICLPKEDNKAKYFRKRFNYGTTEYNNYKIGDFELHWDGFYYWSDNYFNENNIGNYLYDKNSKFYSVSSSNKFDLSSQGKAGFYFNNKFFNFFPSEDNGKIESITDGYNNKIEITFDRLNTSDNYEKSANIYVKDDSNNDIPQLKYLNYGLDVVKEIKSIQATDNSVYNIMSFKYKGAIYDKLLNYFLGFESKKISSNSDVNSTNSFVSRTPTTLDLTKEQNRKYYEVKTLNNFTPAWFTLLTYSDKTYQTQNQNEPYTYIKYYYDKLTLDASQNRFLIYSNKYEYFDYKTKTLNKVYQNYNSQSLLTKKISTSFKINDDNTTDSISSSINKYSYINPELFIYKISDYELKKWHKDDKASSYRRKINFNYYLFNESYPSTFSISGNDKGLNIKTITYDPDINNTSVYAVCEDYLYDAYGNLIKKHKRDYDNSLPILKSQIIYDNLGKYPLKIIGITGSYIEFNYDSYGNLTWEKNILGEQTSYQYNNMNELNKITYPDNTTKDISSMWCNVNDPFIKNNINPKFKINICESKSINSDTINSISYFDSWGQNVINTDRCMVAFNDATSTITYNNVCNAIAYNSNGMIDVEYGLYNPAINSLIGASLPPIKNFYSYDLYGRTINTKLAINNSININKYIYNTNSLSHEYGNENSEDEKRIITKTYDASGNLIKSINPLECELEFKYLDNSQIKEIKLNPIENNKIQFEYDSVGRKTKMIDPDAGTMTYKYNAYGELYETEHIGISKTNYYYDNFRRLLNKTSLKYNGNTYQTEGSTSYKYYDFEDTNNDGIIEYFPIPNGIGQIKNISYHYSSLERKNIENNVGFVYNSKGLLINKMDTLLIDNSETKIFNYQYQYDDYNRLIGIKLPSVTNANGYGEELKYYYNKIDDIIKIERYDGSGYSRLWKLSEADIFGNPKLINLGSDALNLFTQYSYNENQYLTEKKTYKITSGISNEIEKWLLDWDVFTGNLMSREIRYEGNSSGFLETYNYDKSERLSDSKYFNGSTNINNKDKIGFDPSTTSTPLQDNRNNIKSKNNTGYYIYEQGENDLARNAVKYLDQKLNDIEINETDMNKAVGTNQTITYNSFNSVEDIVETVNISTANGIIQKKIKKEFYYNCFGQRILMITSECEDNINSPVYTETERKYYGDDYEYTDYYGTSNNDKEVSYIGSPTGLVAAVKKVNNSNIFYYVLTDQLGSITQLLGPTGSSIANSKFSYDAWGRVRTLTSTTSASYGFTSATSEIFEILGRGYTGHEHLLDVNIINMNGRIYDPVLGQFMQADNYISDPTDFNSYNRYAYCLHNPFKYTDPSGENPLRDEKTYSCQEIWVIAKKYIPKKSKGGYDNLRYGKMPRLYGDDSGYDVSINFWENWENPNDENIGNQGNRRKDRDDLYIYKSEHLMDENAKMSRGGGASGSYNQGGRIKDSDKTRPKAEFTKTFPMLPMGFTESGMYLTTSAKGNYFSYSLESAQSVKYYNYSEFNIGSSTIGCSINTLYGEGGIFVTNEYGGQVGIGFKGFDNNGFESSIIFQHGISKNYSNSEYGFGNYTEVYIGYTIFAAACVTVTVEALLGFPSPAIQFYSQYAPKFAW